MRTKNISAKVKDVDKESRKVKLYYSIFDVKDSDGDIIKEGSLQKTQKEWGPDGKNRIWHLDNHMPTARVGKPIEMGEDSKGAWAVTKVSDTRAGKDLMILYDDGAITEHSFGFEVVKSKNGDDATILTELKQYEYSSVTWGANMFTNTIDVKSEEFKNQLQEFDKWQDVLQKGELSEESCQLLEIQIKQWEQQFKALTEPPQGTPTEAAELDDLFNNYKEEQELKNLFYNG